jgi:dihydrolipoamide dehydrogenase
MKVACIDKRPALGGTCLNVGCIPSKALLESSELFYLAKSRFPRHGIGVGDVRLDLKAMMNRKNDVVKGLNDGVVSFSKSTR